MVLLIESKPIIEPKYNLTYKLQAMRQTLLCSVFVILLLFVNTLHAKIPAAEKDALIDLYNTTKGAEWTITWNLNEPATKWHGVTIKNDHVKHS